MMNLEKIRQMEPEELAKKLRGNEELVDEICREVWKAGECPYGDYIAEITDDFPEDAISCLQCIKNRLMREAKE